MNQILGSLFPSRVFVYGLDMITGTALFCPDRADLDNFPGYGRL